MIKTEYLVKKFNILPSNIAYIGANEGQEISDMKKYFPDAVIYCFEPQKEPFEVLKNKYGTSENIEIYNFALGSENGSVLMHINDNNNHMSSSILEPKKHLDYHKKVTFKGTSEVVIKRFGDLEIKNINYLKIDVQGYELEVLKGIDSLDEVAYVSVEVNRKELYKNCPHVTEIDEYLKKYNLIRVATVWWRKTGPWGDAFYIHRNKINFVTYFKSTIINKLQNIKGYFYIVGLLVRLKIISRF